MDYDVTPITAHSNTDYASYKAFYRFNLFVRQPYTLLIYLAMPVIMAAIMLHVEFGLTMTTIYCVVVYALLAYSIVRNMKRNYRQWTRLRPNGVDYIFYDKEIKSIAPGGSSSYSSSFSYGLFKMVYETESAFYLYMTNQQAAVVEKGGISGGTPQELEELLKSRVGIEKYRKMKSSSRPASASASPSYVVEQERAAQTGPNITRMRFPRLPMWWKNNAGRRTRCRMRRREVIRLRIATFHLSSCIPVVISHHFEDSSFFTCSADGGCILFFW